MEYNPMGEQALDFDDFANQLLEQGADQSPAHLHGAICGVLAGAGARDPDYCLAAVSQALELDKPGLPFQIASCQHRTSVSRFPGSTPRRD